MGNRPASHKNTLLYSGIPRVKGMEGYGVLPEDAARIVGEYLSDGSSHYAEIALSGVQPITLLLSQDEDPQLGSCWDLNFLSPELQWIPEKASVNMKISIKDLQGDTPASFVDLEGRQDCPVLIDVLVVQLSMTSYFSSNALVGLRKAITALEEQLKSVNHVVISITEYASCYFSFKDVIDNNDGWSHPIDRSRALFQIVDDLSACWKTNYLTACELFAFYFENKVKPASETYLVKFVLVLNHPSNLTLVEKQAFNAVSNKLMWVCSMKSEADFRSIPKNTPQLWSAIYFDVPAFSGIEGRRRSVQYWKPAFRSETSSFVERIHFRNSFFSGDIKLPQPRASLAHADAHSALIELSLFGDNFSFHLTQLNTGFFPNLKHLTLVGVKITGHLDSHAVPHLKKLWIEPAHPISDLHYYLVRILSEHQQSVIHAGRPWQLVATEKTGGWSLASYEERMPNPQVEVKEGSPYPLPLIRDLLLVMGNQEHANQWQSQLNGNPSVEAAADDHKDRILMWSPECVQKITLLGATEKKVLFDFRRTVLGRTPILTSLYCVNVRFALDGSFFPHLHLFEVDSCDMKLSGAFPNLQMLTFKDGCLESRWQVNAPLLRYVHCEKLDNCSNFSFQPQLHPHLCSLSFTPRTYLPRHYPEVAVDKDGVGFSHLTYAGLADVSSNYSFFNRFLVESVPDLWVSMDVERLPEIWFDTAWLCEELDIVVYVRTDETVSPPPMVLLPTLPRVKKLTVKEDEICHALIDKEMPNLTDLTVSSPRVLGPNLRCPALQRIQFEGSLSDADKRKWMNQATYSALGARPREVFFNYYYELHRLVWDVALVENGIPPFNVPLEDGSFSSSASSSSATLPMKPS